MIDMSCSILESDADINNSELYLNKDEELHTFIKSIYPSFSLAYKPKELNIVFVLVFKDENGNNDVWSCVSFANANEKEVTLDNFEEVNSDNKITLLSKTEGNFEAMINIFGDVIKKFRDFV